MNDLVRDFELEASALGHLTSAVQFGFISGTLLFALLTLADRFSPSKLFLVSAVAGAIFNVGVIWEGNYFASLITFRFLTGFSLAGIYPVGMKIAADYFEKGLGKSLGYLVGALVLGTAFPHLLKEITETLPWKLVLFGTSGLAVTGGFLMLLLVPDGPYRTPSTTLNLSAFLKVFKKRDFRSAAFGYFGHMWELYTFWAFVPVILRTYLEVHPDSVLEIPFFSFLIIGIGGLACVLGAYLSTSIGARRMAGIALFLSCLCCISSPLLFMTNSTVLMIGFLLFWGLVVIADSPMFSTLVAYNAPGELKGTALTIVNCIGFSITIISIQILSLSSEVVNPFFLYTLLGLGPVFGLLALYGKSKRKLLTARARTV